jgi:hypothetical protein
MPGVGAGKIALPRITADDSPQNDALLGSWIAQRRRLLWRREIQSEIGDSVDRSTTPSGKPRMHRDKSPFTLIPLVVATVLLASALDAT